MGCSPSKGKLFSKPEGSGPQQAPLAEGPQGRPPNALLAEAPQEGVGPTEEGKCFETREEDNEPPLLTQEPPQLASDTMEGQNAAYIEETEANEIHQEITNEVAKTDTLKKFEKRRKSKGKRRSGKKQRKSSIVQTKFDFPPHMVRAHQAAYAFLNPNISKYEALLGLLDQAAQTQLSLQPTMSAFLWHFEEINQALEEMAEEGELMLKEHGDNMLLPSGMMGPAVMLAKSRLAHHPSPPPDLLQQLLKHSTEKMKLVGGSVQALGDTTLEEAVEYFASLSQLLVEKLQAKQAAEQRLTLVLARVQKAATWKLNPEDSALHSEDSGIGGENESLTGSERHRRHRGSAGSGSCGSGSNVRGAFDALPGNLLSLVGYNEYDEEDEDEEEEEDEEDDVDEGDGHERKRSNSSPPDPSQSFIFMCANYMKDQQSTSERPLTAVTSATDYSSTRCVNIMMELQKSQKNLDQRVKNMCENRGKGFAGPHHNFHTAGLRRHSVSGSASAQRGPFRSDQSLGTLPALRPQPPKHQSVRRLINTFSQGVDGRPGQSLANIPPHIRRSRKCGIIRSSNTVKRNEEGLVINDNNNNNRWPESKDDLDEDNLPPPPPEVLMDDSFQSTDLVLPIINQKTKVCQRLKASVHNVEVLPNRASVKPRSISILPARQGAVLGAQDAAQQQETDLDPETEKANCLYQQARKMIRLSNAGESYDKRDATEVKGRVPSPPQAREGRRTGSPEFHEGEMPSHSPHVTAPPVSRARLPPSYPSVCHRYPSPPAFRPSSSSRPSSRPSSPKSVARETDNNAEEIIPSVSFRDARSVFCRKDSQSSQTCSLLPKPWGEAPRGRLHARGIDDPTRRTQSEQRPEFSKDSFSTHSRVKGKEPLTTT
ncbi:uncharacterized protein pcare2 [Spinachia spinachia]